MGETAQCTKAEDWGFIKQKVSDHDQHLKKVDERLDVHENRMDKQDKTMAEQLVTKQDFKELAGEFRNLQKYLLYTVIASPILAILVAIILRWLKSYGIA